MRGRIAHLVLALVMAQPAGAAQAGADDRAPSPEERRTLIERVIANQHRNDAAMELYERLERRQARKNEQQTALAEEKTFRVVPTGTGTVRVLVEENGRAVDAAHYRKQLRDLEQALIWALDPAEPKQKRRVEKAARRARERTEMVEAARDAFLFNWAGRETSNGRRLAKFALEPNPAFKPASRNTSLLTRVRATLWLDESAGQLARVEAEIIRDISFGGGVLGKVYRGGRFVMEQAEVAPGVWLPTRYEYNFEGRKFLFGFELHELTEASRYRRIGPPKEALAAIRSELNNTHAASSSQ